jgi:hypothetical integral membrane protein (TIGR02206 family)
MDGFRSFSLTHAAAVAGVALAILLFVRAGRAWRGQSAARRLETGVAVLILLFRAAIFVWNLFPSRLAVERSLPLQICDLAALCSAWALLSDRRWPAAIAYFWGLALSIQGLVQPDLREGPASLAFWLFWLHHALIVGVATYLVTVRRFRPTRADLRSAIAAGVAYAALVFGIDAVFDMNYGYLGRQTPSQPTILDWLGPWPWRVVAMMVLGVIVMTLLYLPWAARSRPVR